MAANIAVRHQLPVALFTLEMSKSEVTQRLMCSEAKVESQRLRSGKLAADDWPRLTAACDKLAKAPIYVDDTGSITMMEIRSKARRLKTQEPNLGLIIVDYLQLMTSGATVENRVQEVSQISRQLKVLARDLDVPVLAMSQLSRAVEQRHDKRPILSDLRESGCLTGESQVFLPDEGTYASIAELVGREGLRVLALNEATWRFEPRQILRAFSTGRKPVYWLSTRLGRTIRATGNHKFLAYDGWRRLDDLATSMRIAVPLAASSPLRPRLAAAVAAANHDCGPGLSSGPLEHELGEVFWDEVVRVERDGEDDVYDLTIDGLHNFVADDIVVHNSIEQDSDLVFFIYRDEYYNEETDQQGLAEVICAKHRNGPTGSEKLSFLKRYAKFADLAA
jgi:replicative DNA helicase